MCYHVSTPTMKDLREALSKDYDIEEYESFYHTTGFAHQQLPVATAEEPHKIQSYIWGFLPSWANETESADLMNKTLNARAETIFTTPMFRGAAPAHRCLVFVSGFFEWQHHKVGGKEEKTPYYIYADDGKPIAFGGLYSDWKARDGSVLHTCNHITVPANHLLAKIHNSKKRMPLILPNEAWSTWLDPKTSRGDIEAMMRPLPDGQLQAHTISKLITQRGADTDVKEVQEESNEQ